MDVMSMVGIGVGGLVVGIIVVLTIFRRVVKTNEVHIVQSKNTTISYGSNLESGNVYYEWPSSLPIVGVTIMKLPVSNFDLSFGSYEAYDQDRVPFEVDITAFFRIANTNKAAQRVNSIRELETQLKAIVQGAVRSILASTSIDKIMTERETFGKAFTEAVASELPNWGVETVKCLELMDIKDAEGSNVIANIMAKKKSEIEMESRVKVAENNRKAELSEIEAGQITDVRKQEAEQLVGEREAEKEKTVGIAREISQQEIKQAQSLTAQKDMAVEEVKIVRQAEINRAAAAVKLEQAKHDAKAIEEKGAAEAKVKTLIFEADNALEIRLSMQKEMCIGVAEALAQSNSELVPKIVMGGNGENAGSGDATDLLSKLMSISVATNLDSLATSDKNKPEE